MQDNLKRMEQLIQLRSHNSKIIQKLLRGMHLSKQQQNDKLLLHILENKNREYFEEFLRLCDGPLQEEGNNETDQEPIPVIIIHEPVFENGILSLVEKTE